MWRFMASALLFVLTFLHINASAKDPAPAHDSFLLSLAGKCIDEVGEPLAGVRLQILRYELEPINSLDPPQPVTEIVSAADGTFGSLDLTAHATEHYASDLLVVASLEGHVSQMVYLDGRARPEQLTLELDSHPGTLVGFVRDPNGNPLPGALVSLPIRTAAIVGFRSGTTDASGKFRITDLRQHVAQANTSYPLTVSHPDYARTTAWYSAVPAIVNIKLEPAAVVEGRVIDQVTGEPLAGAIVSAQGIEERGWFQARTDTAGNYRLMVTADSYNIWCDAEDRVPLAVDSLKAVPGAKTEGADIRLVRGAMIIGRYIDSATGQPFQPTEPMWIAHYGPARPRSGAAVTSARLETDGSFRLRVAPGRNYIYAMNGGSSAWIFVEDEQEFSLDLHSGRRIELPAENAAAPRADGEPPTVGTLLQRLKQLNAGEELFKDSWLQTLKQIVELGPDAVPELIQELDRTQDDKMMRCLGFCLRAIGDPRAVPALIRAIPKTLIPPGSDMGLRSDNQTLMAFAHKFDLDERDDPNFYSFGRPVREVFGAIQKLTKHQLYDDQLFHCFLSGTNSQQQLKQAIFNRQAIAWSEWWDDHAEELGVPPEYRTVNLPELMVDAERMQLLPNARYRGDGGHSGWVLESISAPAARVVFFDFDTSRASPLPQRWQDLLPGELPLPEIEAWAASQGFDMYGLQIPSQADQKCYAIKLLDMQAWELDKSYWKAEPTGVTLEALMRDGRAVDKFLFHEEPNTIDYAGTASFLVITREGTPGLFFLGVEVLKDSQKPGGIAMGDQELHPIGFRKGRRFGFKTLEAN